MVRITFHKLLQMLRCIFAGETSLHDYDRNAILSEAQRQALTGIVTEYIASTGTGMPHADKMRCISNMMQIENGNRMMNRQVAWLAELLESNGIRYAVMKGQTVARFYPNPLLRMPGDIDVYIAERDFDKTCRLLERQGYSKTDFTMLHATYSKSGCAEVEVHFAIQKLQWLSHYKFLQSITRSGVDMAEAKHICISGKNVAILPTELEVLLYTIHAFNHVLNGGLGLRQITDWMLCIRSVGDEIDMDLLNVYLHKTGMMRMFRVLGYICSKYLGLSLDTRLWHGPGLRYNPKDAAVGEKLLVWVMNAGNFGHSLNLSKTQYYALFLRNCCRFSYLNRKEMFIYPFMKIKRGIMGENHLRR